MNGSLNKISNIVLLISAGFLTFLVLPFDAVFRLISIVIKILGVVKYLTSDEAFFDISILLIEVIFIIMLLIVHIVFQFIKKKTNRLMISTVMQLMIYVYFMMHSVVFWITGKAFKGCSTLFFIIENEQVLNLLFFPFFLIMIIVMISILVIQVKTSKHIENDECS